ncbi:hypothetical protein ACLOJK_036814 [Asimina triloba]
MSFIGLESSDEKPCWECWGTSSHTPTPHNTTTTTTNPLFQSSISFFDFSSPSLPFPPPHPSLLPSHSPPSTYSHFITNFPPSALESQDGSCTNARMGLNLGHRTYFSSQDDDDQTAHVIERIFKRSRGFYHSAVLPGCQAEGCKADLSNAKHYHRRHKVREFHSKASKVVLAGGLLEQRFCQQCSSILQQFDEMKRSCRKRLADHNRRRRKPQPAVGSATSKSTLPLKADLNGMQIKRQEAATRAAKNTTTVTGPSSQR